MRLTRTDTIAALLAVPLAALLLAGAETGSDERTSTAKTTLTDQRMSFLGDAILRYYEDAMTWPPNFKALVIRPDDANRWFGPYISTWFANDLDAALAIIRDAWGRRIGYKVQDEYDASLVSFGNDRTDDAQKVGKAAGLTNDRQFKLNADRIRWRESAFEVDRINRIIKSYQLYHVDAPLPADWEEVHALLVQEGYLPAAVPGGRDYLHDAWGQVYEHTTAGDPPTIHEVFTSGRP